MLTTNSFVHLVGASYRQVHYWCAAGIFGPDLRGEGSGRPRLFPPELVEAGMAASDLSRFVRSVNGATSGAHHQLLAQVVELVAARPVGLDERLVVDGAGPRRHNGWVHPRLRLEEPTIILPLRRYQPERTEAAR